MTIRWMNNLEFSQCLHLLLLQIGYVLAHSTPLTLQSLHFVKLFNPAGDVLFAATDDWLGRFENSV